jgi:hypothetical protein
MTRDVTRDALSAEAVGIVYEGNIWQAGDPAKVAQRSAPSWRSAPSSTSAAE